jgi:hypothetical protein
MNIKEIIDYCCYILISNIKLRFYFYKLTTISCYVNWYSKYISIIQTIASVWIEVHDLFLD